MSQATFPGDFLWGVATSAYQIEGSPLEDGAGPSNWHRFAHEPGRVLGGDHGDRACDHYRRYAGDLDLVRELGLNAYRFSLNWSRIRPEGRGRRNPRGLDFYERLIDAVLERGLTPFLTLHHWDMPLALEEAGGWTNPDTAAWFADYVHEVAGRFDDRVPYWASFNEPWVIIHAGLVEGVHPPGRRDPAEAARAAHGLLRAHAQADAAYRAVGRHAFGIVVNLEPKYPASEAQADLDAAARATAYMNRWFLEPVVHGRYPERLPEVFGAHWPDFPDADVSALRAPPDFIGVNYYTRAVVRADPAAWCGARAVPVEDALHTDMGWEVYPQGLTDTLRWVHKHFGERALYVTENGAAFPDGAPVDGRVTDPERCAYFEAHLAAAREARADGVDLRGYFAWSLLDNFEWQFGYARRFGLVHVDFATQRRTLKDSARVYARLVAEQGVSDRSG
ncbi:MAG: GH1 family beta-glucosidase [Halothiobacillaceae bacterium]|nr:GH1 family beta-glucosidase [Halothiobacillaceae bacterium]